ncbi:hypothetical protein [Enterobacter sp. UPMP2052]
MNPTLRNKLVGAIAGGSGAIFIAAVLLCTADGPGKAARRTFSAKLLSAPARRCCFFTNQFYGLQQRFRFLLAFCAHRPASHLAPLCGHPRINIRINHISPAQHKGR